MYQSVKKKLKFVKQKYLIVFNSKFLIIRVLYYYLNFGTLFEILDIKWKPKNL